MKSHVPSIPSEETSTCDLSEQGSEGVTGPYGESIERLVLVTLTRYGV